MIYTVSALDGSEVDIKGYSTTSGTITNITSGSSAGTYRYTDSAGNEIALPNSYDYNTIVPQSSPDVGWYASTTTTSWPSVLDSIGQAIKDENGQDADTLGVVFVKDRKIYMRAEGGKTICLGEVGNDGVGKKISIAITKKKLKKG